MGLGGRLDATNVIPVPARGGLPGAPAGHVRYELCGLGFDGTLGSDTLAERAVLIARPEELALMAPAPYVPNTLPGKVRVLIDLMLEQFGNTPSWDPCQAAVQEKIAAGELAPEDYPADEHQMA